MKVSEAMTRDVDACSKTDTLGACAQAMKRDNIGAMPILDENSQLVGIITDRDIVLRAIAEGADCQSARVFDFMTPDPVAIDPDSSLEDAEQLMAQHKIRRLPVLFKNKLVGMLSFGDVAVNLSEAGSESLVAQGAHEVFSPLHKTA